jgi:hypothetical protein
MVQPQARQYRLGLLFMGDRQDNDFECVQIEYEIARLIAECEMIEAAIARSYPFDHPHVTLPRSRRRVASRPRTGVGRYGRGRWCWRRPMNFWRR